MTRIRLAAGERRCHRPGVAPDLASRAASAYISRMSKLGMAVAALLAIAAMGVAWQAWTSMAATAVGTAGLLAMIGGAVATLALGGALIALLFISNRRGFDDRAGRPEGNDNRESRDR